LITDNNSLNLSHYPFNNMWYKKELGKNENNDKINIYYHNLQQCELKVDRDISIAIIGHAYNTFTMVYDEESILIELIRKYKKRKESFFELLNELTGIHLIVINDNGKLIVVQDCMGMKSCYYGNIN